MRIRTLASTVALVLLVAARAEAAPEPSAGDLATARNALIEGLALREKGDLLGALGRLTTAQDLVATPVTVFELGKTHLLLGHVLQAHELFLKIGRLPLAVEESPRSTTAREEAKRLAVDLEPRIPTLRIRVLKLPPEASAIVHLDDEPVTMAGAVTPRSVDPGKHVIIARAGDGPEVRVTLEVAEGETKDVDLAPLWVAPKPPPTPPAGQVVYLRQTNPLVFLGFTAASVAATVTGVAAVLAVNAAGRANDRCGSDYCPQYIRDSDVTEMRTWIGVTAIAGAATLAFLTVAVISISRPVNEKLTARARPYVGAGSVGLVGAF